MGIDSDVPSLPVPVPLITAGDIQTRVAELGLRISRDYEQRSVVMIGILNGAVVFLSDLIRHINVPAEIDFMAVRSYGNATQSSGQVKLIMDVATRITARHVIIVEDIVDTGRTLQAIQEILLERQPASLAACVLLDKPERRVVDVHVDYTAFTIPNQFVVGYGLDSAGYYRNLDYIGVVES
jgi:hypoxanthine phosphoribosyltransferase